ncbi:hypothetical protein Trydic_g5886 [Trypoxylus dichotomus]
MSGRSIHPPRHATPPPKTIESARNGVESTGAEFYDRRAPLLTRKGRAFTFFSFRKTRGGSSWEARERTYRRRAERRSSRIYVGVVMCGAVDRDQANITENLRAFRPPQSHRKKNIEKVESGNNSAG